MLFDWSKYTNKIETRCLHKSISSKKIIRALHFNIYCSANVSLHIMISHQLCHFIFDIEI